MRRPLILTMSLRSSRWPGVSVIQSVSRTPSQDRKRNVYNTFGVANQAASVERARGCIMD